MFHSVGPDSFFTAMVSSIASVGAVTLGSILIIVFIVYRYRKSLPPDEYIYDDDDADSLYDDDGYLEDADDGYLEDADASNSDYTSSIMIDVDSNK